MITLQHTLVTLLGHIGSINKKEDAEKILDNEISYVLLPDAIRRYCGQRQYSHFEEHPDNKEKISWMEYPSDVKHLSKEVVDSQNKYLAENIPSCVLGENTHIEVFEEHNRHLNPEYFAGVKKHLTQDVVFDEFIREQIDCSRKFEDKFFFKDNCYDGKGVRSLIADIENQGVYVLAYMLHQTYGITANQEWFDKHVKRVLDREYPEDLAEGTYKYMQIPEEIDKRITEGDWTHLNDGIISFEEYVEMYRKAIREMPVIDEEKRLRKLGIDKNKNVEDNTPDLSEI